MRPNPSRNRTAAGGAGAPKRLRMLLAALDTAQSIEDMNVPGFRLHPLKGSGQKRWSVWVSGNWRLTFAFSDRHAYVLDYEDYR